MRLLYLFVAMACVAVAQEMPRASWIENGLIDAGGNHEPYIFVVRRGGQRLDARQQIEGAQSEEVLRRLKAQGAEVFHTHLYKGFGMAAEMPDNGGDQNGLPGSPTSWASRWTPTSSGTP